MKDYVEVLKAVNDIPFGVGRKLLLDYLKGSCNNASIIRNRLDEKDSFGSLELYTDDEVGELIDFVMRMGLLQIMVEKFYKVLVLTEKGFRELSHPTLQDREIKYNYSIASITPEERVVFENMGFFLDKYNDEQKKAIVSNKEKVLCIAGAGSGKTTVLTKRVEFLTSFKGVDGSKILAITFTRKAKEEMQRRLKGVDVQIETFNSFCEKILKRHNDKVYDTDTRVIKYGEKIKLVLEGLKEQNYSADSAVNKYFTVGQRRGKTNEQLMHIFVHDCFTVLDYYKNEGKGLEDFSQGHYGYKSVGDIDSARMVYSVCKHIDSRMKELGLRDFSDQLADCMRLFEANKDLIPKFSHLLIDEYQDVNSAQIKLVRMLDSANLFCVGDPRQSIFGWRGSKIKYVMDFQKEYSDAEVIVLTKNYRSVKPIVDVMNSNVKWMCLPDLEGVVEGSKDIKLIQFGSEQQEREFVVQSLLANQSARNEIFVLARTNRQLAELSQLMNERGIKHIVRSDEVKLVEARADEITLATVHAIKGLEAEIVYMVGCNGQSYPCKASDHPVLEMVKMEDYDKEEEELRLFYVGMSRARKSLYMSYSGSLTRFVNSDMKKGLQEIDVS